MGKYILPDGWFDIETAPIGVNVNVLTVRGYTATVFHMNADHITCRDYAGWQPVHTLEPIRTQLEHMAEAIATTGKVMRGEDIRPNLSVKEAQTKRQLLASTMLGLVRRFELETGMTVYDARFHRDEKDTIGRAWTTAVQPIVRL